MTVGDKILIGHFLILAFWLLLVDLGFFSSVSLCAKMTIPYVHQQSIKNDILELNISQLDFSNLPLD